MRCEQPDFYGERYFTTGRSTILCTEHLSTLSLQITDQTALELVDHMDLLIFYFLIILFCLHNNDRHAVLPITACGPNCSDKDDMTNTINMKIR